MTAAPLSAHRTRSKPMTIIPVSNAKLSVVFRAGALPRIDPDTPEFLLDLGGCKVAVVITGKAARKLAEHQAGAILQGKLVSQDGRLHLVEGIYPGVNATNRGPQTVVITHWGGQTAVSFR